ncbi:MAG: cytochrome c [Acidobacteria bacterium]|nr:cytochrome c [Acidobacteriota bacterium]MBI3262155.1 cytochrome c [Acidobacteriota bacterium]
MQTTTAVFALAGAMYAGVFYSSVRAQQPAPAAQTPAAGAAQSVLEGVYTEEQGKRGDAVYGQECSTCHGASLEGGEMAPALAGAAFMSNWQGLTVGDLFERIRISMPDGNPGKLSRQQIADVVAFILSASKYPAGKTELPKEVEFLKQMKIEPAKPQ